MNRYPISWARYRQSNARAGSKGCRRGAAVIEAALLTPLLVVVTLGAIDVGQYINVTQTLSNASRIGARQACRDASTQTSTVVNAVRDYIAEAFPQYETADLASAIRVSVHRANGTPVVSDLNTIPSGEQLFVRVSMQFAAVRWMGNIDFWSFELPTMECYARRE